MGETGLRVLGAVIQILLDVLFEFTGRNIFSLLGLKPHRLFNVPVGLVFWFVFGCVVTGFVSGMIARYS
jgi:hypothetical protein